MYLSTNIRHLRTKSDIQQKQLAMKLGIPDRQLRMYENGEVKNPSFEIAIKIADFFGVSLDELIRSDLSK